MNRSRTLVLLMVVAAFALLACPPRPTTTPPDGAPVGVDITSRLAGTVAGGARVDVTLAGTAAHIQRGRQVIFVAKQLVAVAPDLGPLTATLNPQRESVGTLSSENFPARHEQNFFLRIQSERLGTLVSDAPLTLSAEIQSSPPTATYESTGGAVAFYKEGDRNKTPVLTVDKVTSDVKPAASTAVNVTSRVTARVDDRQVNFQVAGTAVHLLRGRNVLFIAKRLVARDPGDIGPVTVVLNPRGQSFGTLSSERLPAEHTQNFFLEIQSERLGTLVSDAPVVLAARIESSPPTATYKFAGEPVAFYKRGDRSKRPVLTIDSVESDVTPAAR